MTPRLPASPRVVLTGGASGLGRAFALAIARRGALVLVTDVDLAGAEATARDVTAAGGEGAALRVDVGEIGDLEAAADAVTARWGGVDLVINNAGVAVAGAVGEVPLEDWTWVMRVNLWGVIHGCHVFAPRLKAQGAGAILNVASGAGFASLPTMGPYNVSKAGVISLSETLRGELGPHGVAVSVLCPTFFPTNLLDTMRAPAAEQALARGAFRAARATAEGVADAGLRGLERGDLVIIPQPDGRLVWRAKRLAPGLYHRFIGSAAQRTLAAWLSRRGER